MAFSWKDVPHPIIALSPMADMTDSAFCRTVKNVTGSDTFPIVFREMVSAEAVVRGNEKTLGMTSIHASERPLVQQIFGSDPKTMAEAARIIEAEDHPEAFDINMGCPVYKIVSNFNGCALMKDANLAHQIVTEMKAAITVPLSVKIRLGWNDPLDCLKFVKVLEEAGADLITIHGRTRAQGYSGVADWEMVGRAKQETSVPVLCNGDIHTADKVKTALDVSGCDGVLIARGALGNPWFFKDAQTLLAGGTPDAIEMKERIRVILLHLDYHLEEYGSHGVNTFRKHLSWYFKGISHMKEFKDPMMKATEPDELRSILHSILENHPGN